jgi:hypothetical protein
VSREVGDNRTPCGPEDQGGEKRTGERGDSNSDFKSQITLYNMFKSNSPHLHNQITHNPCLSFCSGELINDFQCMLHNYKNWYCIQNNTDGDRALKKKNRI